LGKVEDALSEVRTISRVALGADGPQSAVSLQVFKRTGGNIIEITDSAKQRLDELRVRGVVPASIDIVTTNDNSKFIRDDLKTLGKSGLQTIVLILVALSLALAFRMAIVAAVVIPVIFLMALGIVQLEGATLNSLTLFSLVLSLGLLVDTVIVLIEGIYDALRKGFKPIEAALYSIQTYKIPITAGVLTTIAAFVPMLLVGGIVGDFLKTLPLTISATLGASLFVSLILMPGIAAAFLGRVTRRSSIHKNKLAHNLIKSLVDKYTPVITKLLRFKKSRQLFITSLILLLIIGFGLLSSGVIKTELFPKVDIDYYWINIELPQGTTLDKTNEFTKRLENRLGSRPRNVQRSSLAPSTN